MTLRDYLQELETHGELLRVTKPISKTKRWAVEEIIRREERAEDLPEA